MNKNRKFLFIFLIILVVILVFFILSNIIFAEEVELKDEYSTKIWQVVKQGISDEITEITSSSDFKIEEQAALVIIKQAIKADIAHYLFIDVPKEVGKSVINAIIKLAYSILTGDPALVIGEIEKLSVEKAKEYAIDWLLQNEIRTSNGNLEISYSTYRGNWEKAIFPYNIVYHPLGPKQGEVGIEIYSSKVIKTPFPSRNFQWEGGIEELKPFIVRINGELEYVDDVYRWVKEPQIDVVFDEPVPEFKFEEPGLFDKLKSYLDKTKKAFESLKDLINIFSSKLNIFQATVGPSPNLVPPDLSAESPDEEQEEVINPEIIEEIGKKIEEVGEKVEEKIETGSLQEFDLKQAQEILDDIAEKIDILSQKVAELVGESEGIGGPIEPVEELEEEGTEEELVGEEELEDEKTAICFVEINTASKEELQKITGVGPVKAQLIIEARPFSSINDLVRVSGIGEITLQKIIEQGCAYVEHYTGGGGGGGGGGGAPTTYPKILISEIQISPLTERFVELYNPNNQTIDLTSWYIQRKTQTSSSWDSFISSTKFEGKTIPANGYFLISKQIENSNIVLDLTLSDNNSLVLKNPNREIVDKVGWGEAQDYETAPTLNPEAGQSIGRKWINGGYQDNDNNQDDFETQEPTPKTENSKPLLPQPILEVSLQNLEFSIIESATPSGTEAFNISNAGDGSFEWQGIIDYATPSDASWLKIEPSSGQVSDETSEVLVSLTQEAAGLANGNYEAEIIITAQGAEGSPQSVEVELKIEQAGEEELPTLEVIINEIAWMGTGANSVDEWIELYNNTDQDINLFGWRLKSSDGGPNIIFGEIPETSIITTTTISTNGFYLLERTDDNTISDIPADWQGSFGNGLGNNPDCEILSLYDQNDNLIDRTVCLDDGNWPAGKNEKIGDDWIRISMERIDSTISGSIPENWADNDSTISQQGLDAKGNLISGTPRAKNSSK
ncbi:MAG: hypothetical protein COU42_02865 [Candidatus Nealsonbacteria bacterium CG10_big_fil_rev_8_21_14_0_10_36_24]|uniref:LTD domain-containing protein n=2 Tax=Candidatus Nealsoniibacteriota TaxID=1817911 RepID=A0A2H0YNR3_9BACT|nr:MAG: hypothetical protein COU42_02865 [Candidatus Nealsonbacteria bacterium CG10_big_fil_rev_8_21_14_0_10_36_24]PIS40135.1 MAG: hypothetical protein COT32_01360 [Candidatus Nealsonbacteria bacterium CG08_land_8_20_14_0_20_36_22]